MYVDLPKRCFSRCKDDGKRMMEKKLKGGVKGQPHWLVERDVRRRTSLPQNGGVKQGWWNEARRCGEVALHSLRPYGAAGDAIPD